MARVGSGFNVMASATLVVNEIYASLQGESSWAGWPCVFVRLTGCPLRCSYCDTAFAFAEGQRRSLEDIVAEVARLAQPWRSAGGGRRLPLVEVTGGEPLAQSGVFPLLSRLCDEGYTVLLETSGALDIGTVDPRVVRIMDLKGPSSGERERNRWDNLEHLRSTDEVKFVVGTEEDYAWMKEVIRKHELAARCPLLVSWAAPLSAAQQHPALKRVPGKSVALNPRALAEGIMADGLPVRFQLQLHKIIWPPDQRGV